MRGVPLWLTVPLFALPFSILMFDAAGHGLETG
jgi:hypothetical protein